MPLSIMNTLQQAAEQNLADIENTKASGTKVVGTYCLYSPVEVLVVAGAVTLPLCGTRNDPIAAAEEVLPEISVRSSKAAMGSPPPKRAPI